MHSLDSLPASSPDVMWMLPQTHKTPNHKSGRRTSLGFDAMDTRDMAHTLAYLDFKLFRRISVSCVCPSNNFGDCHCCLCVEVEDVLFRCFLK